MTLLVSSGTFDLAVMGFALGSLLCLCLVAMWEER